MIVKNTGTKNFGVGACTFFDLFESKCTDSCAEGIFEFMQSWKEDQKVLLFFI